MEKKKSEVISLFQVTSTLTGFTGNSEKNVHIIVITTTGLKLSRAFFSIFPRINLRLGTFSCVFQVSLDLEMFEITFVSIL